MGLLGQSGAGACPNLPQRRPEPGSAADESAEYQRFSFGASVESGSLWQIWTTRAAADPREARRGPLHGRRPRRSPRSRAGPLRPERRDVHFALERALLTAHLECKMHLSRAECTSRRAQDRPAPNIPNGSRPHRPALTPAHGPRLPVKEGSVNWATASRDRIGPCIALTMGTRPGDGVALPPTPRRQLNGVRVLGMKERGGLDSEAPHGASCRRHHPAVLHHPYLSSPYLRRSQCALRARCAFRVPSY